MNDEDTFIAAIRSTNDPLPQLVGHLSDELSHRLWVLRWTMPREHPHWFTLVCPDWMTPAGLTARGLDAARLIRDFAVANGVVDTGGCGAFQTPTSFKHSQAIRLSRRAVLTVGCEGSQLARAFIRSGEDDGLVVGMLELLARNRFEIEMIHYMTVVINNLGR
jgi:hypothetical protein